MQNLSNCIITVLCVEKTDLHLFLNNDFKILFGMTINTLNSVTLYIAVVFSPLCLADHF